jgi:hypothetical protein
MMPWCNQISDLIVAQMGFVSDGTYDRITAPSVAGAAISSAGHKTWPDGNNRGFVLEQLCIQRASIHIEFMPSSLVLVNTKLLFANATIAMMNRSVLSSHAHPKQRFLGTQWRCSNPRF